MISNPCSYPTSTTLNCPCPLGQSATNSRRQMNFPNIWPSCHLCARFPIPSMNVLHDGTNWRGGAPWCLPSPDATQRALRCLLVCDKTRTRRIRSFPRIYENEIHFILSYPGAIPLCEQFPPLSKLPPPTPMMTRAKTMARKDDVDTEFTEYNNNFHFLILIKIIMNVDAFENWSVRIYDEPKPEMMMIRMKRAVAAVKSVTGTHCPRDD